MVMKHKSRFILSALSVILVLIMLLGTSACGKDTKSEENAEEATTEEVTEAEAGDGATMTDAENPGADGEETTAADGEEETTADGEDTEGPTLFLGVNDFDFSKHDPDPKNWTMEEIVACYKAGMAKEDSSDVYTDQKFELTGDLPGSASILKKPVNTAMKLAAQPYNALTGGYWDLTADDLKKADAHKEGKYVIINLYPKEQVDGPYGNEHEGHVGHVVNVVQGIDSFLEFVEKGYGVLNASYEEDSVKLTYKNAYAKNIKIDTTTGKMVSGRWGYDVYIWLDHCKLLGVKFEDFTTSIRWECWYPVED